MKNKILTYLYYFQVFSSGRRETGGGFSRTGSSSLSLLPYFDMADLASSGPYIVSIPSGSYLLSSLELPGIFQGEGEWREGFYKQGKGEFGRYFIGALAGVHQLWFLCRF